MAENYPDTAAGRRLRYYHLREKASQVTHPEVFYAFSEKQYNEAMDRLPKGSKVYSYMAGMFATRNGLFEWAAMHQEIAKEIRETCDPQTAYEYECDNHEFCITGEDDEAMAIIREYWPAAEITRRRDGAER